MSTNLRSCWKNSGKKERKKEKNKKNGVIF